MIPSDREPLSPNRAAQANAGGAHHMNVQDPAKQKPGITTTGPGAKPGVQTGPQTYGPRAFWARDRDADKLDYVSIMSLIALAIIWIVLLATETYVGILLLIGYWFSLALLAFFYFVGSTRYSVRINDLVRAYWMGILFFIPVAIVEGVIVTKWWNGAGQNYIDWSPSRAMRVGWAIGAGFFLSFLVYGWFENTLKYLAIRPHMYRPIYYHPMGLPLLGMAVGLGFATCECLFYVLVYGFLAAIVRGVIRIPFMGIMGAIIGTMLARHRWGDGANRAYISREPTGQPGVGQGVVGTGPGAAPGVGPGGTQYTHEAPRKSAGLGLYLKSIIIPFILTGWFDLPFVIVFMRHRLYSYWSFWFLASLVILIISLIVWLILSRSLRALGPLYTNPAHGAGRTNYQAA